MKRDEENTNGVPTRPQTPSSRVLPKARRLAGDQTKESIKIYSLKLQTRGEMGPQDFGTSVSVAIGIPVVWRCACLMEPSSLGLESRCHVFFDRVVVVDVGCRSVAITVAANGRRWCPLPQEPKLLGGTLVAISSRPATRMLFHGKQLV